MTSPEETRRIAERYYAAWTSRNEHETRALLADDVEASTPLNTYHRADALLPPLMKVAGMLLGARMLESVVEGERAALLYEFDFPPPVGTLRTASFLRIEKGRIRAFKQEYDATEFRKILSRKSEGG